MTTRSLLAVAAALGAVVVAPAFATDAPKVFERGGARLYIEEKRIEMKGRFCLAEGPIELLACAKGGKEYESVISLEVNPEMLHLCLLMMGCKPGKTGPLHQGDRDHAPTGDPVIVKVKWEVDDAERVHRAEDLCWNVVDRRPMDRTHWVFAGSRIQEDPETGKRVYWANVEKSVIVVYRDPFAVLDLPLALGVDDDAYVVNKALVPKVGTPCTVILEPGQVVPPEKNAAGGTVFHVDVTGGGRVLVNGVQFTDLKVALRVIARYAPLDSCKVTIDHGPTAAEFGPSTAAAAADAFEALEASGIAVESVESMHLQSDSKDAVTIEVGRDEIAIGGKPLSDKEAGIAVRGLLARAEGSSVVVEVGEDATLAAVVRAFRACDGAEGGAVRVVWGRKKPPGVVPGPAAERPRNRAEGGIFRVEVRADGQVLVDGAETLDPEPELRVIGVYAPKDSCSLTVNHGAPAGAIARVFSGLGSAQVGIESVQMTRVRDDVADAATVVVAGNGITVDGKALEPTAAAKLVPRRLAGKGQGGVAVQMGQGARLDEVAEVLQTLGDIRGVVLRLIWDEKK